jgi:hypothetical protein
MDFDIVDFLVVVVEQLVVVNFHEMMTLPLIL